MSKRLSSYWRCGFGKCFDYSQWKLNVSEDCFITVCDRHVVLYRRIYPKKVERLSSTQRLPKGWEFIKQKSVTVGAVLSKAKGMVRYGSR